MGCKKALMTCCAVYCIMGGRVSTWVIQRKELSKPEKTASDELPIWPFKMQLCVYMDGSTGESQCTGSKQASTDMTSLFYGKRMPNKFPEKWATRGRHGVSETWMKCMPEGMAGRASGGSGCLIAMVMLHHEENLLDNHMTWLSHMQTWPEHVNSSCTVIVSATLTAQRGGRGVGLSHLSLSCWW